MAIEATEFRVRRDDLATVAVAPVPVSANDGEVLLRVDRFALTSNNITYAAHGEDMGYWRFYPTRSEWGIIPVWGFATVLESRCEGVGEGDRVYGYWPMASHAVLRPERVSTGGFTDASPHRAELPGAYNCYQFVRDDGAFGDERVWALFRPLFLTAFLLDDQLAESDWYGAGAVLLSSASSKTALGLAAAITARPEPRPAVIGLTSPRNLAFADAAGGYADVLTYDRLETLFADTVVYVDFAGDGLLRRRVHELLGDRLKASIVVGDTHWAVPGATGVIPGPRAGFFFAPTRMVERTRDLGRDEFDRRLDASWREFVTSTKCWLRIFEANGAPALEPRDRALLDGSASPADGIIASLA